MAEGSISYILDRLFDSFSEETISHYDDVRNYNDVSELSNESRKLTVTAGVSLINTWAPVMIKVTE